MPLFSLILRFMALKRSRRILSGQNFWGKSFTQHFLIDARLIIGRPRWDSGFTQANWRHPRSLLFHKASSRKPIFENSPEGMKNGRQWKKKKNFFHHVMSRRMMKMGKEGSSLSKASFLLSHSRSHRFSFPSSWLPVAWCKFNQFSDLSSKVSPLSEFFCAISQPCRCVSLWKIQNFASFLPFFRFSSHRNPTREWHILFRHFRKFHWKNSWFFSSGAFFVCKVSSRLIEGEARTGDERITKSD